MAKPPPAEKALSDSTDVGFIVKSALKRIFFGIYINPSDNGDSLSDAYIHF